MDLLETTLISSSTSSCLQLFRDYNIDPSVLPLLTDEDLIIIGVDKEEDRKKILKRASTLIIPHDKEIDTTVTKEYIEFMLKRMSAQLTRHDACLNCAIVRDDVVVCDVKLNNIVQTFTKSVDSLERQLNVFDKKVNKKNERKKYPSASFLVVLGTTIITLVVTGRLVKDYILK